VANKKKESPSQDFLERKRFLELEEKLEEVKHRMKMDELEFARESNRLFHERELERGRIKTAEIRKAFERKDRANRDHREY